LIITGDFISINGISLNGIARLNPNGSLDTSFRPALNGAMGRLFASVAQPDGKMLVVGSTVLKWLPDATLDPTFHPPMDPDLFGLTSALALSDGRIVVGGDSGVFELNSDGSRNTNFKLNFPRYSLNSWARQSDDRIVYAGNGYLAEEGIPLVGRFNADGVLDESFRPTIAGYVHTVINLPDDRIFIGGNFTAVDNVSRHGFALLDRNGHVSGAVALYAQLTAEGDSLHLTSTGNSEEGFLLQASTNLIDWLPVYTNAVPKPLDLLERISSTMEQRYYRAVPRP
jgi:uncharacterized delta-60 repeat protein